MIYANDEEIARLVGKFENSTATEAEWTHAAHLTAALWYCTRHDYETALEKMRAGILRLNEAHGTPNTDTRGYHETLTIFWMRTVFDYVVKAGEIPPVTLANNLINTFGSNYPLEFYSREVLFSPESRAKYIEPNLKRF